MTQTGIPSNGNYFHVLNWPNLTDGGNQIPKSLQMAATKSQGTTAFISILKAD